MGDLVRHTASKALDRSTSRALTAVHSQALLAEAAELTQAYICEVRIDNAVRLGTTAALKLSQLDHVITAVSADRPGLELNLRRIEDAIGIGAGNVIINYLQRR